MTSQAPTPPRSLALFGLALVVAFALFARSPGTGFVYDEQEAILANPYLRGDSAWLDAFRFDFWGLPVARTIGSYRPLPNLLWWPLACTLELQTPFFLQLLGPALHAVATWLLYLFLRRHVGPSAAPQAEWAARLGALVFLVLGVVTEAVTTVVGQADVLVAIWTLLGLLALDLRPGWREAGVFGCCLLGLLSKETMLGSVALLCAAQLVLPGAGKRRFERALGVVGVLSASLASIAALVLTRRHFFLGESRPEGPPLALPELPGLGAVLAFFEQPRLPVDPQNNPLALAEPALRVPTALAIYAKGLFQMLLPVDLVADYSFPREAPHGFTVLSWIGLLCLVVPLVGAVVRARRRAPGLLTLGLAWIPLSYLPVSNLLVLLPTIRAERLLYVPALGLSLLVAASWPRIQGRLRAVRLLTLLLVTSAVQARAHALHYESDVLFWRATTRGAPASAKSHLNLGVMVGARGDAEGRIRSTARSVQLAPRWPMAHVYLGDAYCRAGRAREGIPHYVRGLELAPNQKDIAALTLQCLWETGLLEEARDGLEGAARRDPNGWLAFLLAEVSLRGQENGGVPKQYRAHGYNQR